MPSNDKPESVNPAAVPSTPATAPGAGDAPPSPPEPSQAALDKKAERLEEKAEDAQAKADALAADAEKAKLNAAELGLPRAAHCPACGNRLERYTGGDINPHKVGTHWCPTHGRIRIEHGKIVA